jgi:hypothetical protein
MKDHKGKEEEEEEEPFKYEAQAALFEDPVRSSVAA